MRFLIGLCALAQFSHAFAVGPLSPCGLTCLAFGFYLLFDCLTERNWA